MGRKVQVFLAALISWPVAAQEYTPTLLPAELLGSPQTMTPLNGGDDSTRQVQFSFPFSYYGQTFTSAWVSSNGFVSFESNNHLCCNGLPMDQAQRNTIYGYWTDLISGGNPYYRSGESSILFGWYGTNEYGTQNRNTFEINLLADGSIQFNYGALANTWHLVSAGITGPTSTDNIQLFYGQNVQNLQNQSGILAVSAPLPEPEPPMQIVSTGAPEIISNPITAAEPIQEQVAQETTTIVVSDTPTETVEESAVVEDVQATVDEVAVVEQSAVAEEPAVEENTKTEEVVASNDVERLDPNEVAALAAAQDTSTNSDDVSQAEISNAIEAVAESASEAQSASESMKSEEGKLSSSVSSTQDKSQAIEASQSDAQRTDRKDNASDSLKNDLEAVQSVISSVLSVSAITSSDTSLGGFNSSNPRSDKNIEFFQREAIEDSAYFNRETVLQVSAQNLAFVAQADAQYAEQYGEQTTTETAGQTYALMPTEGPTFASAPATGMGEFSSPIGQAQQLELLGMQGEMSAGTPTDVGDMASEDNSTMVQLAAAPEGYSAYTQARIPDLPFYQPKDIYKGRRIPDANLALYRMMRGQDQTWDNMVEAQYE
jgi:hypothetical protein